MSDDPSTTQTVFLRRRRESITAEELLTWFRARWGTSWQATINDIEHAIDDITKARQ